MEALGQMNDQNMVLIQQQGRIDLRGGGLFGDLARIGRESNFGGLFTCSGR